MKDYGLKLRHVLPTFIKVAVSTALFYLLCYFIFVIKLEIRLIDYFTDYILPAGLSTLSTVIWIRPKLKLLVFKGKADPLIFYYLACIGHITWLLVAAASWLVVITNPLINLNTVEQLENSTKTRFYKIQDYNIDTKNTASSYVLGKNKKHRYYYMELYFVAPFSVKQKNVNSKNRYWIVKNYYNKQSSGLDKAVRNKYFNDFKKSAETDFKEGGYAYNANHFERLMHSTEKKHALKAIRKIRAGVWDKDIIVFSTSARDLSYEKESALKIMYIALFSGIFTLILMLIFPGFNNRKLKASAGKNPLSEMLNLLFKT